MFKKTSKDNKEITITIKKINQQINKIVNDDEFE